MELLAGFFRQTALSSGTEWVAAGRFEGVREGLDDGRFEGVREGLDDGAGIAAGCGGPVVCVADEIVGEKHMIIINIMTVVFRDSTEINNDFNFLFFIFFVLFVAIVVVVKL